MNPSLCRWSFLHSADSIRKQEYSDTLPNASVQDLGVILMGAGYEVYFFILVFLLYSLVLFAYIYYLKMTGLSSIKW